MSNKKNIIIVIESLLLAAAAGLGIWWYVHNNVVREVEKTFEDGSTYKGEWLAGRMHGRGVLTLADGEVYEGGFKHNEQSVRIVEKLEKDGEGLNLTWEVRDGILNHQTGRMPHTLEGKIVRLSDKIAYVNSDFDDAIRAQILCEEDIPLEIRKTLGYDTRSRLDCLIHDIIINSKGQDDIIMSEECAGALKELRGFMFTNLYLNPVAKSEEVKAGNMLHQLYNYYMEHIELLPPKFLQMIDEGEDKGRVMCDFISGMTDQFAINRFTEFYLPEAWQVDGF